MLERLDDLPPGVLGLKAVGKVSKDDYEQIFEPLVDEARRENRRLRFLYQFGDDFEGFTPGAMWEDTKLSLRSMRMFDGCAIVSDIGWIRASARVLGMAMSCPVRVFSNQDRHTAIEWLASLADGAGVSHHLLADTGVMVVEVRAALRTQDFDALSHTADAWIEEHGDLQGVVIHAREFSGWESIASFLRHVRFVRDHHRKIERVALATDAKLASLAPRVGQHFVKAQVKTFRYDELQTAMDWAAGRPVVHVPTPTEGAPSPATHES